MEKKKNNRQRLGLDDKPANQAETDLGEAEKIQANSKVVIKRIIEKNDEAAQVGSTIVKTIGEDNEKLFRGMIIDFEQMDNGVEQSRKLIRSILISMQRDKCIKVILFIILLGLLAVLIWAIFDPNFKIGGGDGQPAGTDRKQ